MRLLAHIAVVLVLVAVAPSATSAARNPEPQELWQAYPLQPGHRTPPVRLPVSSAAPRARPQAAATATTGSGGAPVWPLIAGTAAIALLLGALAGRRARRPVTATVPAAPAAQPPPAPPRAAPPPPPVRWATAAPAAPKPAPPPEPRVARPEPRVAAPAPAPPEPPVAAPEPPVAAPEPPVAPPARRFGRVAWPTWSRPLWRCEITRHHGFLHADFRAVAHGPDRHRGIELARSGTHTRPGWGVEPPEADLEAAVLELGRALVAAGWEPIRGGRDRYSPRFVWPRAGTPPLELRVPAALNDEEEEDENG